MAPPGQRVSIDKTEVSVRSYRTEHDTHLGTVWRLILDDNTTIVVTPYQLQALPAKQLACLPEAIESIYEGALGYIVGCAASVGPPSTFEPNNGQVTTKEGSAPIYREYLEALRRYLDTFDAKLDDEGAADLYGFVKSQLARQESPAPPIRHQDLNLVIQTIFSLTGTHIGERAALRFSQEMPSLVESWAKHLATLENIPLARARQQVVADAPFVATFREEEFYTARSIEQLSGVAPESSVVFPKRALVLVSNIARGPHDERDRKQISPASGVDPSTFNNEDFVDGSEVQDRVFTGSRRDWDQYREEIARSVPTRSRGRHRKRVYYHLPSCIEWYSKQVKRTK